MLIGFAHFLLLAPLQAGLLGVDEGTLTASDAAAWDYASEALAMDSETAVIGARWHDGNALDTGAAYVYLHAGSSWSEQQKLTALDASAADEFGASVAIDGDTIVVGAPTADLGGLNEGAAYVFTRVAGVWSQQAKLTAADLFDEDRFGSAVAVFGDTLVVGAMADDDLGDYSGSAYVFTRSSGMWTQSAKLTASDGTPFAYFGHAAVLENGTAVIGAPGPNGGAYVFVGSGTTWTQQAKLHDPSPVALDRFGEAICIAGDTVAVGSPMDDDNGVDSGAVVIFDRSGVNWSQTAQLLAGELYGELGRSVSITPGRVAAGAPRDRQLGSDPLGMLYVFELTNGTWSQAAALSPASSLILDDFGQATSIDGELLLVGTPGADGSGVNSGAAQAYRLLPGISRFCFGDGSGALCPCANSSSTQAGCANSSGMGGGLQGFNLPSLSNDSLVIAATDLLPGQPALLFSGLNALAGGLGVLFGDGLRCVGGAIVRVGVMVPDAGGTASWGPGIPAAAGVASGDTRRFQCWYRDPLGTPCGSAFNLTNGVEVTFTP